MSTDADPILAPGGHEVIEESFDGETVIVHLATGRCYSLDAAARTAWRLLGAGARASTVAAKLHERHLVAPEETRRLIAELEAERLLVPAEAEGVLPPADSDGPLGPPKLQRVEDLRDLRVRGPAHDTDARGDRPQAPGPTAA